MDQPAGFPLPHTPPFLSPQERLQNLWEVYQRLGLEDDIVDPSNELIKEGPIHKISFRNNTTSDKYLFLVRRWWMHQAGKAGVAGRRGIGHYVALRNSRLFLEDQ